MPPIKCNAPGVNGHPAPSDNAPAITHPFDAEVDIEVTKAVPQAFEINSEATANWLVRKIVSARQYAARVREWAEQEQRRAAREERTLMFLFGMKFVRWAKGEVERLGGRKKSLAMPAGQIGFTKFSAALQVDDEHAVLAWARSSCPSAVVVRTSTTLSKTELKVHFERTGEVPPDGAHVQPAGERFYVRENRATSTTDATNPQ